MNNASMNFVEQPNDHRFRDITGKKFGLLTAIGYAGQSNGSHRWFCECECGVIKSFIKSNLNRGRTKSCGCAKEETKRSLRLAYPAEYRAFKGARQRCKPNGKGHPRWGGRGILFRFDNFVDFLECLGERPTDDHSLDRIDNDGNYEPGNVRWAVTGTQANNTRTNIYITIDGETLTRSQWCERLGVNPRNVRYRTHVLGMSEAEAILDLAENGTHH